MAQIIYCDESGFTGNNLSNVEQPHFVYAGVAITPEEATEIKDRVIRDYRVNGVELKGKNLVKYPKGRKAVSDILEKVAPRSQCVVMQKKYTTSRIPAASPAVGLNVTSISKKTHGAFPDHTYPRASRLTTNQRLKYPSKRMRILSI